MKHDGVQLQPKPMVSILPWKYTLGLEGVSSESWRVLQGYSLCSCKGESHHLCRRQKLIFFLKLKAALELLAHRYMAFSHSFSSTLQSLNACSWLPKHVYQDQAVPQWPINHHNDWTGGR